MKGDFSRLIFDRRNHYAGVLHQQGRVWLDSDWNEDVLERLDLAQQTTFDVVGACGVPIPGTAFQISPNPDPDRYADFIISGGPGSQGRAYVAGLLCRMEVPCTYLSQPDLPAAPPVGLTPDVDNHGLIYLAVWRRLITSLEDPVIADVALGGPDTTVRLKTVAQVKVLMVPAGTECNDLATFLPSGDGTLTTVPQSPTQPTDLCSLPDPANYTGLANRFYRVEIHHGGGTVNGAGVVSSLLHKLLAVNAQPGDTTLRFTQPFTVDEINAIDRWSNVVTLVDGTGRSETVEVAAITSDRAGLVLVS